MDTLFAIVDWTGQAVRTFPGAIIAGGIVFLLSRRLSHRSEPSDVDVRRAAERYRQWYGDRALLVIGDHMLGARFAPDSRHTQFLKRVVSELQADAVTDDRRRVIES